MNFVSPKKLRLLARNEGKIKSYESCYDVRAWSHDVCARDRHLREWIKCDMPICILPMCTLASFLRTMTCKSRGKTTPRCHPNCKSKILLESICTSCHAMKECLKNDERFEKYFDEEEFETSHWPCEKCLEALKSIKMFWKVIIEKIFNINPSKIEQFETSHCTRADSIQTLTKIWQNEIVEQALLVKNVNPLPRPGRYQKKDVIAHFPNPRTVDSSSDSIFKRKVKRSPNSSIKSYKFKVTDKPSSKINETPRRKVSRCTSVKVKLIDAGCDSHYNEEENEELKLYRNNLDYLQQRFNVQKDEMEKLRIENHSLKIELENIYKKYSWKSRLYMPVSLSPDDVAVAVVPKPFESCVEENIDSPKNIDSEMIITMKNCKNETFKHVSLLQVVHKTNEPITNRENIESCYKKEDPIDLLNKVQNAFGAIVKREMSIVNDRKRCTKKSNIDASFQRVNVSRSAPSCSTIATYTSSSDLNFCHCTDSILKPQNMIRSYYVLWIKWVAICGRCFGHGVAAVAFSLLCFCYRPHVVIVIGMDLKM